VWLKELKTHSNPDAKVFLIGNKVDLEDKRKINKEVANKFKEDYNLDLFMEASAKTGFNAKNVNANFYNKFRFSLKLLKHFIRTTLSIKTKSIFQ
jgi:Ras-related protein Rab-5C